jgi:hypothetical protein
MKIEETERRDQKETFTIAATELVQENRNIFPRFWNFYYTNYLIVIYFSDVIFLKQIHILILTMPDNLRGIFASNSANMLFTVWTGQNMSITLYSFFFSFLQLNSLYVLAVFPNLCMCLLLRKHVTVRVSYCMSVMLHSIYCFLLPHLSFITSNFSFLDVK